MPRLSSRTINIVAGVVVDHLPPDMRIATPTGTLIAPCITLGRAGRTKPLVMMSPDDADKLADELRAAAAAARAGEEPKKS